MCETVGGHRPLLSKLQSCVLGSNACVARVSVWPSCKGCVPLPSAEGGAERRVRVRECVNLGPHPALRATFSQREKDTPSGFSLIWTTVIYDHRPRSCNVRHCGRSQTAPTVKRREIPCSSQRNTFLG